MGRNLRQTRGGDATDFFLPAGYTGSILTAGGGCLRIYLDLTVLLNFGVDLLLLLGTNRLAGFPPGLRRLIPAALLGAFYSGACLLPGFRFLGSTLWRLASLGLMAVTAFGWNPSALKRCGIFLLLSMALGGTVYLLGRSSVPALLLAAAALWGLSRVAFGGQVGGKEYVSVELAREGHCVHLTALRDTGNTLRDPVSGEPVLVIGSEAAEELTGLTRQQLSRPLETLALRPLPGLRLVPYHAVGNSGGMLLAMRFRNVRIGQVRRDAIVAFACDGLGRGEVYQALTGGL